MQTYVKTPANGQAVTLNADGSLNVPDNPIIPFIEGDGIGVDVTPAMRTVIDAAVAKAYGGKRKIEWLEIRKSGMRYIVDVEARIINDIKKEKDYCHVIATKDGLIKRINVYDGEGIVSFNDYVKKGDILISGDVKLNDNVVSHSCASGDVYAEVWYTVNVKVPLKYYENKFTGKKRNNYIINFNGIDYKIFNDRLKNYESSKKKIFDLLGIKIYLEKDEEIEKKALKYTEKEALEKGLLLAKEKILLKLKKDDLIIDEKILQKKLIDSTMDIDIFIITQEYIGQIVEAKEDEINDL